MTPPFLTASFNNANAAVVPVSSNGFQTHFLQDERHTIPTAGVGAKERSTIPKGTPKRSEATRPTSCPIRVILKAVFLTVSATTSKDSPLTFSSARLTTPGPADAYINLDICFSDTVKSNRP